MIKFDFIEIKVKKNLKLLEDLFLLQKILKKEKNSQKII